MSNSVLFTTNQNAGPNYKINKRASGYQIITDELGRQTKHEFPAEYVQFEDWQYRTSDPTEIEWLRTQRAFTGAGGTPIDYFEVVQAEPEFKFSPELDRLVKKFGEAKVSRFLEKLEAKQEREAQEAGKVSKPKSKKKASVK